jgi:hypothetical protein
MSSPLRIQYAEGGPLLEVRAIAAWDRGFMDAPVGSSSGPKDYIKNDIWSIFQAQPEVNRVVMVRASGSPFLLIRSTDNRWYDVTGKQVIVAKLTERKQA